MADHRHLFLLLGLIALLTVGVSSKAIYGSNSDSSNSDSLTCVRLDAAVTYKGITYLFVGDHYITLDENMAEVSVEKSDEGWGGLPRVEAAIVWPGDGYAYFFDGDEYYYYSAWWGTVGPFSNDRWDWRLMDGVKASGGVGDHSYFLRGCDYVLHDGWDYQGPISLEDSGLPCGMDAGFQLNEEELVFVKGDQAWKMSEDGSVSGPHDVSEVLTLKSVTLCGADEDEDDEEEEEEESDGDDDDQDHDQDHDKSSTETESQEQAREQAAEAKEQAKEAQEQVDELEKEKAQQVKEQSEEKSEQEKECVKETGEPPAESATQKPAESVTQQTEESVTEKAEESATHKAEESATQKAEESATQKAEESATEKAEESATQAAAA